MPPFLIHLMKSFNSRIEIVGYANRGKSTGAG